MATRLSEPVLRDALTRLAGWSGDDHMIRREFTVEAVPRQRLVDDIEALAALVHHTILVTDTATGLGVTLATDDVDGVSEVDIAVASRLNDLFNGTPGSVVPVQRQAAAPNNTPLTADEVDERAWWNNSDNAEPVMGVPAASAAVVPAPLPDTAAYEPEPGIEPQQEPTSPVPPAWGE